jgi:hypothetical protein
MLGTGHSVFGAKRRTILAHAVPARAALLGVLALLSACVYETKATVVATEDGVRVEKIGDGRYVPADDVLPLLDVAWNGNTHSYDVVETSQNGGEAVYAVRVAPLGRDFYVLQREEQSEPNRLFLARLSDKGFTLYEVADAEKETWVAVQNDVLLSPHGKDDDRPPTIDGPPANIRKFLAALASSPGALKPAAEYALEK